jgi:dTDP-4-dehydrorhamnose 3,5-epimerase
MRFRPTALTGAWLIEFEPHHDERGSFSRTFCAREFAAQGLRTRFPQLSEAHNARRGALRGMHWQAPPHAETKIVRCVKGAIFDVIVDLRPTSPTYLAWQGFELHGDDHAQLYVPEGCAHGYLTLTDGAVVSYMMSCAHVPAAARGFRYDDPAVGIAWPGPIRLLSAKDKAWPAYAPLPGLPAVS